MSVHESSVWARAEVARKAQAILSGELGVLDGCIPLAQLAHDVVPDWRVDRDFLVFGVISSSIDHLPFGSVRRQWSAEALARADSEIALLTDLNRDDVLLACRNVVDRFGAPESNAPHGAV